MSFSSSVGDVRRFVKHNFSFNKQHILLPRGIWRKKEKQKNCEQINIIKPHSGFKNSKTDDERRTTLRVNEGRSWNREWKTEKYSKKNQPPRSFRFLERTPFSVFQFLQQHCTRKRVKESKKPTTAERGLLQNQRRNKREREREATSLSILSYSQTRKNIKLPKGLRS